MPGGRKSVGKASSAKAAHHHNHGPSTTTPLDTSKTSSRLGVKNSQKEEPDLNVPQLVMPKHVPIPDIPRDSDIVFELLMFMFTTMALFLQYLHLYRTVWWLPHSYTKYAINFYLIDCHLVFFILFLLGRRIVWCICKQLVICYMPKSCIKILLQILRCCIVLLVMIGLGFCTFYIVQNHPTVNIFYLCYPISVYFILFGLSVSPFLDLVPQPISTREENTNSKSANCSKPLYHTCLVNADGVRDEVNILKTDFNSRMKQVLFNSLLSAYYAGFVPCCFAQSTLHYDVYWVTQHLAFVWLGCFTMYIVHCYPAKYCDTLHRSALHLGKWHKVEGRIAHLPYNQWSHVTLWHQGTLVKYMKELYKAEGITNAAEPGNSSHARFYAIFNNPSILICALLVLQFTMVLLQLIMLVQANEWHYIISLALLLFSNYYTLFKLARDYMILWKIYKAEQLIQG